MIQLLPRLNLSENNKIFNENLDTARKSFKWHFKISNFNKINDEKLYLRNTRIGTFTTKQKLKQQLKYNN